MMSCFNTSLWQLRSESNAPIEIRNLKSQSLGGAVAQVGRFELPSTVLETAASPQCLTRIGSTANRRLGVRRPSSPSCGGPSQGWVDLGHGGSGIRRWLARQELNLHPAVISCALYH